MKIIFSILGAFLVLNVSAQINNADAFFKGRYDKAFFRVHKIRQVLVRGAINGRNSSSAIFDFDHNGFITTQTILDTAGKKINEYFFTYNEQGDQVERKNIAHELNKIYTETFSRKYQNNRLVEETSSDLPFITVHAYDSGGQLLQSITFLGTDTVHSQKHISNYHYDNNGRLISTIENLTAENNASSTCIGNTAYIYDQAGNIIGVKRKEKANYELTYDSRGFLKNMKTVMPEEFDHLTISDEYSYSFWE